MSESIHVGGSERSHAPRSVDPGKMDMSKVTGPILLHLLSTEVRFPRLFLIRCRLTLGRPHDCAGTGRGPAAPAGESGVYQVLASKRAAGATSLPVTRRHLYL